jgi:hypothetical protein
MKQKRKKVIPIVGGISTSLGGLGIIIAEIGLCPCVLVPIISFAGFLSITLGFLLSNKFVFLIIGILLLTVSYIFHHKKKTCHVHVKKKQIKNDKDKN